MLAPPPVATPGVELAPPVVRVRRLGPHVISRNVVGIGKPPDTLALLVKPPAAKFGNGLIGKAREGLKLINGNASAALA